MGLISWLQEKFGTNPVPLSGKRLADFTDEYQLLYSNVYVRELAFWSAVNMIANAVSKCEFKTFKDDKETKGAEYYLWNIKPNQNQNSSGFIHQWIATLFRHNECLIVEQNGQLLIADDFQRKEYALYESVFSNVTVRDFTFNQTFTQSEVLYWRLTEKDMHKVTAAIYESYSKLLGYSMNCYQKSRGTKGIFSYETLPVTGSKEETAFNDLVSTKFKQFMSSGDAILPLGKGQSYTDVSSKTYSNETTRDIRALIDDVSDFTAKAFGIPPALLRGDVQGTSDALNNFLTFCIDPLVDMLQEEIIGKRYGQAEFAKGNYLKIDTKAIKHVDLLSVSTAIDKLISSGAFSVNDIRKLCGETVINEPWADKHFMTKNYAPAGELLAAMEGGGEQ